MPSRSPQSQQRRGATGWSRDFIVLALFAALVLLIFITLCFRMVVMHVDYSQKADDQHLKTTVDVADRGTIYDRNGEVIASSVDSVTINVNPNDIDYSAAVKGEDRARAENPATAVARIFERYLGDGDDHGYDYYYDLVTRPNTAYVIISRKVATDVAEQIRADLDEAKLIGVYFENDSTRVYPNGDVGSQVIGAVDIDGIGIAGLELQYDGLLAGSDGFISSDKSTSGIPIAGGSYSAQEAVDGEDMVVSIDIKLQQRAEERLVSCLEWYKAAGGSVMVMDAATGEIYAAASFTRDRGSEEHPIADDEYVYTQDVGKLWNISDSYEPGSTFKSFTAYSVLANSDTTVNSDFYVPSELKVYDSTVTDSHEHGDETMSLERIIAESSNIGTVNASRTVQLSQLYDTYHAFGFGQESGVDFPGAASGLLEETGDWDGVQAADITFGQGVSVTGIQLIRAYGALEQRGEMPTPHFLTSMLNEDAQDAELLGQLTHHTSVADAQTCNDVIRMLRSVVEWGTGTPAAIDGYTVVGKTGTAEVASSTGRYIEGAYIASFVGWLDNTDSDLVCLVTVERPQTEDGGGGVCGPVFADIMSFAADRYHVTNNRD